MFDFIALKNKTKQSVQLNWPVIVVIFTYSLYYCLYFNAGMFWDSVTILSKPATYLFNQGLLGFHYPATIDNGDPQMVPFLIALSWRIFGRTLFVTHLVFTPIIICILLALFRLATKLFPSKYAPYVFALVAADPSFMSQTLGLYQDTFLILFSLLTVNALLNKNRLFFAINLLLLCLVSRRGMLLCFAFMLANFLNIWLLEKEPFLKTIKNIFPPYLPAAIFVFSFITWRLNTYGWFFTTSGTDTGQAVPLNGMIRNFAILIRWFIDNGRLFLWLAFIILFLKLKDKNEFVKENRFVILIFIGFLSVMMCVTIPIANQFGARYFIIHYLIFALIVSKAIIHYLPDNKAKITFIALILFLFTSNFWRYPEKLSQSWDSSLSNLSYFELREKTIEFFNDKKINLESVGVGFPMYAQFDYVNINSDKRHFSCLDFRKNEWVVYSNVFNSTDDDIIQYQHWIFTEEFRKGNVFMRIYRRPNKSLNND